MAQRLIGVRQTCQHVGAGRANLHLGRAPKAPRLDTLVQAESASQNIPLADGAGHTLPAAAPVVSQHRE